MTERFEASFSQSGAPEKRRLASPILQIAGLIGITVLAQLRTQMAHEAGIEVGITQGITQGEIARAEYDRTNPYSGATEEEIRAQNPHHFVAEN